MNDIISKVYKTVLKYNMIDNNDKVLVALSGGADSIFMCIALTELRKCLNFEIYAAHLNHGIRGAEADNDARFVKSFCNQNNIKLYMKEVSVPQIAEKEKISEELAGRNERYDFFRKISRENHIDKIAVAHNSNDSAETVILNLIRGSSLKGLSGIRPVNNDIIRPIIDVTREEIETYLKESNQTYCVDCTNSCNDYSRNKVRNTIIPQMSSINPSVIKTIYSNLSNIRDDDEFIDSFAQELHCVKKHCENVIIDRNIFDKQCVAIKKRLIMTAFNMIKGDIKNIEKSHMIILISDLKSGNSYHMPNGIYVHVNFDKIVFSHAPRKKIAPYNFDYKPGDVVKINNNMVIKSTFCNIADFHESNTLFIDADLVNNKILKVRNKINGDRMIPLGLKSHKKLKEIFINLKIPYDERINAPVILDGDEIVAILPYRISDLYKITDKTKRILKIQVENINILE